MVKHEYVCESICRECKNHQRRQRPETSYRCITLWCGYFDREISSYIEECGQFDKIEPLKSQVPNDDIQAPKYERIVERC